MAEENKNLGKNNLNLESSSEGKGIILKKAILATICCWFLSAVLYLVFNIGIWAVIGAFVRMDAFQKVGVEFHSLFYNWLNALSWEGFFSHRGFLPFLLIGFYLGLKKKGRFFFIYPFLSLALAFVFYFFYIALQSFNKPTPDFTPLICITVYFLVFSLLIIKLFHLKKERPLFKATGTLFVIFFIGSMGIAQYSRSTLDPKFCETLARKDNRWQAEYCFLNLALKTQNLEWCEKIEASSTSPSAKCYQELFFLSKEYKDILGKCQSLSYPEIDGCITNVAVEERDIKLCKAVEWDWTKCLREVRLAPQLDTNEVVIITDKTEYEQRKTAEIIVRNGLNKSIWGDFSPCDGIPFWKLQKLENGKWRNVSFSNPKYEKVCDFILCERRVPTELKPDSRLKGRWHLANICEWPEQPVGVPKSEARPIEEGTYRIFLVYGLNKEGLNLLEVKTTYSNEFTIKEK